MGKIRDTIEKAKEIPDQVKQVTVAVIFSMIIAVGALIMGLVALVAVKHGD